MISEIINAITQELKYFVKENDGMVVIDTNLNEDISFNFPLIILEFNEAPESARLPGNGVTRMDWRFNVRVYNQEPDAYIDDETTGSTSYLNWSDLVRNFLEGEMWITQLMVNLTTNYAFRVTYAGTNKAAELTTNDKTYMGFTHSFETISFDFGIVSTVNVTETTQTVVGSVEFE